MIIGYARVSTDDQSLDSQTDALSAAGAEKVFADKISGSRRARPDLDRMLEQLRDGDVVTVTKYDRLARSLKDLLEIVEAIRERGAGFRSLAEDIDTTTPAGRLVFHVFASIAQFERERISERTREGWLPPASEVASVAGPLPCQQYRRKKSGGCEMKSGALLPRLHVYSKLASGQCGAHERFGVVGDDKRDGRGYVCRCGGASAAKSNDAEDGHN